MRWLLLLIVLLPIFVMLEGRRQERKYGRSAGAGVMRAGMLDLQRHLEPERKIEILVEKREELRGTFSGDPTDPGSAPPRR